jgi:AbrB family looped-hinge helix DNA binding protein
MIRSTVILEGAVAIPDEIRRHLGLVSGDEVEFVFNEETGRVEVLPKDRSISNWS